MEWNAFVRTTSLVIVVALITAGGEAAQGIPPPEAWARAEAEILRVEPSAFPQSLPR